ncbi:MAG TPA: hypothetical protein VNV85_18165, partial [Puia sp.]|nr:hypothetical protein [Puia sp.]
MLALVLLFTSLWATGASISSTPAGGNWSATTTWVGGIVPGSSDAATIVSGATVTVDILGATCVTLDINSGAAGGVAAKLAFNSGSTLTVSGNVTIGAAGVGRTGSIIMTNGGL